MNNLVSCTLIKELLGCRKNVLHQNNVISFRGLHAVLKSDQYLRLYVSKFPKGCGVIDNPDHFEHAFDPTHIP